MLSAFLERPQRVLTHHQHIEHAHGVGRVMFDRMIAVAIGRLRRRTSPEGSIRSARNRGYMFPLEVER